MSDTPETDQLLECDQYKGVESTANCPDCEDTGWVGDQEAGSGYRNGRRTKNDEWQPCGCDRRELAKRRIAWAND